MIIVSAYEFTEIIYWIEIWNLNYWAHIFYFKNTLDENIIIIYLTISKINFIICLKTKKIFNL